MCPFFFLCACVFFVCLCVNADTQRGDVTPKRLIKRRHRKKNAEREKVRERQRKQSALQRKTAHE